MIFWLSVILSIFVSVEGQCNQPGCLRCEKDTWLCEVCDRASGFILQVSGGCDYRPILNCLLISLEGDCEQCEDGYTAIDFQCEKTEDGCEKVEQGVCVRCSFGLYLNPDPSSQQRCLPAANETIPSNCLKLSSPNKCQSCAKGFELDHQGGCSARIPECIQQQSYSCGRCFERHQLLMDEPASIGRILNSFSELKSLPPVSSKCVLKEIENCLIFSEDFSCKVCLPHFYPNSNQCLPVSLYIENCKVYSDKFTCSACEEGFYLEDNDCFENPILTSIPNCLYQLHLDSCYICQTDHYLSNGLCQLTEESERVPNCDLYKGPSDCYLCKQGFKFGAEGKCEKIYDKIENCLVYKEKECQYCQEGYVLLIGKCLLKTSFVMPTGCILHDYPDCKQCDKDYFLKDNYICMSRFFPNCLMKLSLNYCLACATGFVLEDYSCVPAQSVIENCFSQNYEGACTLCSEGYYLSRDETECLKIETVDHCIEFVTDIECISCEKDFYFDADSNKCVESEPLPNCERLQTPTTCRICKEGFALIGGECQVPESPIENCYNLSEDGICRFCKTGFYPSEDGSSCLEFEVTDPKCRFVDQYLSCLVCTDYNRLFFDMFCFSPISLVNKCKSYGAFGFCNLCEYPYYSDQYECVFDESSEPQSNCLVTSLATRCAICEEGYFELNGRCVLNYIDHCLSYDSAEFCKICENGYYLSSPLKCEPVTIQIPHCLEYNSNKRCQRCEGEMYSTDGLCLNFIRSLNFECTNVGLDDECFLCKAPHHFGLSGVCKQTPKIVENCKIYNVKFDCKVCDQGFVFEAGSCVQQFPGYIKNCQEYLSLGNCSVCKGDYLVSADKKSCEKISTPLFGCQIQENMFRCSICKPGFALRIFDGKCLENCKKVENLSCTICEDDFYLSESTCLPVESKISNCKSYSSQNTCLYCEKGFALAENNLCVVLDFPNCEQAVSIPKCLVCDQNSYLVQGKCVPVLAAISGCAVYGNSGVTCEGCAKGYYQTKFQGSCNPNK